MNTQLQKANAAPAGGGVFALSVMLPHDSPQGG